MMFTAAWSALILGLYRIVPLLVLLPADRLGALAPPRLPNQCWYTTEGGKRWQMPGQRALLSRMVMLYRDQGRRRTERVVRLMCAFRWSSSSTSAAMCSRTFGLFTCHGGGRASLRRVKNKPLHVTNSQQQLRAVPTTLHGTDLPLFSSRERLAMLKIVSDLSTASARASARRRRSPSTTRGTRRAATLFVNTLPFVLVRDSGCCSSRRWRSSAGAFGIQDGLMIEEPFRETLQLDHMCTSIRTSSRRSSARRPPATMSATTSRRSRRRRRRSTRRRRRRGDASSMPVRVSSRWSRQSRAEYGLRSRWCAMLRVSIDHSLEKLWAMAPARWATADPRAALRPPRRLRTAAASKRRRRRTTPTAIWRRLPRRTSLPKASEIKS